MAIFIIVISIVLIYINYRALKKDRNSNFSDILAHKEENISDIQYEVGKLRREFSETILELQKEIIEIKDRDRGNESNKEDLDIKNEDTYIDNENEEEIDGKKTIQVNDSNDDNDIELSSKKEYSNDIDENVKREENEVDENQSKDKLELVKELINKGYDDDKICESLSIGKGEVLLIRGLLKNLKS